MIDFADVSYGYGKGEPSLSGFSTVFARGKRTALFGDNGAGKSTVAFLSNGLLKPDSGTVRVDGMDTRDLESLLDIRKKVGLVFQNPDSQFVAATVEREIAFGLENLGVGADEMRKRVDLVIDRFNIGHIRNVSPRDLSEGEKMMVAIASTVVLKPDCLVLDEPTSHLGRAESEKVWELVDDLDPKPSLIVITQKRNEIESCGRTIGLASGRKTFDGSTRDFLSKTEFSRGWREIASQLFSRGVLKSASLTNMDELVQSILMNRDRIGEPSEEVALHALPLEGGKPWIETLSLVNAGYVYKKGQPGQRIGVETASLELRRGDFVGVLGSNGSGKTTLSLLLAGLIKPDSGALMVNGKHASKRTEGNKLRREMGFLFQNPERAFFTENCLSEVAFGPRNFKLPNPEERAISALELVALGGSFNNRSPFEISYGEQRRLAIACTLAHDPTIIILDEPTAGLDQKGKVLVGEILRGLKLSGKTVVLVSHDLGLVLDLSDRVVVMDKGRIAYQGSPDGVLSPGSGIELGSEQLDIQKILLQLKSGGLEVDTELFSPRRATQTIINALALRTSE